MAAGVPAPHRQGLPAWLPDSEGTTAPPYRLLAGAPSRRPGRQRPDLPPGASGGGTGRGAPRRGGVSYSFGHRRLKGVCGRTRVAVRFSADCLLAPVRY